MLRRALRITAAEVRPIGTVAPAAAMPAPTTMHPVAILTAVALVVAVRAGIRASIRAGILLRLTAAGNERRQAPHLLSAFRAAALAGLLIGLLLWIMLRPIVHLLIARRKWLGIARQIRLLLGFTRPVAWFVLTHERLGVIIVAVKALVAALLCATARALLLRLLLIVVGVLLAELFLRGGDKTEIVFGMLVVIFGCYRVSGTLRVARELDIFFRNV